MSKMKSFNAEGSGMVRALFTGAAVGIALGVAALPAVWGWLAPAVADAVQAVAYVLSPATASPPSGVAAAPRIDNPISALPAILAGGQRGAFLLAALGVLALCVAVAAANRASYLRWLHDGTWVGGRRAPGAPIHGDARLVSRPSELRRLTHRWRGGEKPEGGTLAVGVLGGDVRLIDSVHVCILAESGEGKSRRIAIISALANFLMGKSLLINDVKGELRSYLEPYFREVGTHRIVDVMFDAPGASARFDPLERAKAAYREEGHGGAARELRELARCIVPSALKGQPFFTDNARNLFVGIALRIIMDDSIPEEQKTVMSVAAAMAPSGEQSALDRITALVSGLPVGHPALPFLSGINGESGGAPGVISTLATYLSEYADGNVARMLHGDECGLDRLGEEPTVFFISSSSATGNYKRLVQTFVAQALSALRVCAARHAGRCPVTSVLVLDEGASLGRNERLVQDLGEMRSEGIVVQFYMQSLLQLQSVSGYSREEAETILDLLKDKVVLSCSNIETARKLSDSLGSYTALSESRSRTKGANTGSTGTSEGIVRRPLITPDELMRWTGRETGALVIHDGRALALPSRDVSETFVAGMLGMTSPEAERRMMEDALSHREERGAAAPPVWAGVAGGDDPKRAASGTGYTPEGF